MGNTEEKLFIECGTTAVYELSSRLGFRSRKLSKTRDGYSLTYEISAKDYQSFVKNVVHPIFKDHDKKEIMSIDFTYTSHKITKRMGGKFWDLQEGK